jgi:hypothetical protein
MGRNTGQAKILKFMPIIALSVTVSAACLYLIFNAANVQALDEHNCLSCHSKLNITKTTSDGRQVSLLVSENDINNSAHKYIDCTTCHGLDPHSNPVDLSKISSAEKCGTCHSYEYQQHLSSIHGQQLAQGNTDVATCVDCHSATSDPHSVKRVLESDATTFKKNIAETCAKCHNNPALMQDYGIVEKVYESYMQTYHGKVIEMSSGELSQLNTATCTNCHGAHNIKAVNDPTSTVAGMTNLVATCAQCHPNAGPAFVQGFLGHKAASPNNVPVAHYVERGFAFLLFGVLGFGLLVVITAIYGFSRKRWRD